MYSMGGLGSGMYGGGMYGGGLGGGMYGSSMYGGGLGGGMYGSGMYGGGLGGGMYGSGMGGGMYGGGMGSSMYGGGLGSGGMLGGNTMNGMGSPTGAMPGALGANTNGNTSLLPAPPDQAAGASPINQLTTTLPPLNETPTERRRRLRGEERKERQLIEQQREQRRQVRMQARMEIAGHLTNVLVQTLRSAAELFSVCFGTYYSMKAVRAFATQQEEAAMRRFPGQLLPGQAPATAAATSTALAAADPAKRGSTWKTMLLFGGFFVLAELLYRIIRRSTSGGPTSARSRHQLTDAAARRRGEDVEDLSEAWEDASEEWSSSDMDPQEHRTRRTGQRMYVAMYDYESPDPDNFLSFRAGDEFFVHDYEHGQWCEATAVHGSGSSHEIRGVIPSNYLRLVESTKL